jgi:hypothetical protein
MYEIIDLPTRCELLSFLDVYLGYHQIPLAETHQPATTFIPLMAIFAM